MPGDAVRRLNGTENEHPQGQHAQGTEEEVRACMNNLRSSLEIFDNATGKITVFIGNPND